MSNITLEQEIMDVVRKLNIEQQQAVLEQVRRLVEPKGEPGWQIVQDARGIGFTSEDLAEMEKAVEQWCEQIDDFPEVDFDE